MYTADASSEPSVSLAEPSDLRVCRDSAIEGDAQTSSPQLGNLTMASDQPQHACKNNPNTHFGTGIAMAAPAGVPSWKRILDITCILVSMPFWLPILMITRDMD